AADAAQTVAVADHAATDRSSEEEVEEIVAAAADTVEQLGNRRGRGVVLAKHRKVDHLLQKGLEMNFLPQAESLSGQAEFPQPGAKIEGHAEPDAGNARTLGRI